MTNDPRTGLDIFDVFAGLRDAMFRYYDTPFGVSDESVMSERRALLDQNRVSWREPLIELRPRYMPADTTVEGSFRLAGAPAETAEFAQYALPPGVESLYSHQHQALIDAYRDGKNFIVTAGTGSGKTEAFLLPIIADLVTQSQRWSGNPARPQRWWDDSQSGFIGSRVGETGRPQALRALILYPTNALADDQMVRLRRALDSEPARAWLNAHRSGHRFYFGRYTGATPVPGPIGHESGVEKLREYLVGLDSRVHRLADARHTDFIPRVDGAEMQSRWDMMEAAPDILVTNYSMLNVMLLRPQEAGIFESTRQWLASEEDARFTLVLDELHTYRGTAGTEVAYLLRLLTHRLGLDEKPEKLRVMGASASLQADRDEGFLREFFGLPETRFSVLTGDLVQPKNRNSDLTPHLTELTEAATCALTPQQADQLVEKTAVGDAIAWALAPEGRATALALTDLANKLFPKEANARARSVGLQGALRLMRTASAVDTPRLRAHMFFRNISGVWACSSSQCPDVEERSEDRMVGRLFGRPTPRCTCGARVLELLYCQTCGDLMLGGYVSSASLDKSSFNGALHTDSPELDQLPDGVVTTPHARNYVVYWPRTGPLGVDKADWNGGNNAVHFEFRPSRYDPGTGRLRNTKIGPTGWSFHIDVARNGDSFAVSPEKIRPFPTRCPACGDDWELERLMGKSLDIDDSRRLRAPVRRMRTGFDKINQVLSTEALGRQPAADRKAIAFSDSRDDASELASGLALRHYQDLLRLLTAEAVALQGDPAADLATAKAYYHPSDGPVPAGAAEAIKRLKARHNRDFNDLKDIWTNEPDAEPDRAPELEAVLTGLPALDALASNLELQLIGKEFATNPGGPAYSLQRTGNGQRWTSLYTWSERRGLASGMDEDQKQLHRSIRESLEYEVLNGLFSSAGRDFESLGLGWLCLTDDHAALDVDPTSDAALTRASLRVLGHMRRFNNLREATTTPPASLKNFWKAVAHYHGLDWEDIRNRVERSWRDRVSAGFIIFPAKVALRPGNGKWWTCQSCRRRHLHPGALVCTKCGKAPLKQETIDQPGQDDYYAWKAATGTGRFRLNTAELTGQTDRLAAQSRQGRFQDVFLDDGDVPAADGLELLSVTTTMEAGVDVGPLNTVLMANMPPTRFNYQQRVGRAGRRQSPVAIALTVCRGRSHDDHYFASPEKITNEETPAPYLSMGMPAVFKRVLLAEVLRLAFSGYEPEDPTDLTRNVHGQFALASDWQPVHRARVSRWIDTNENLIREVAEALQKETRPDVADLDPITCLREILPCIDRAAESRVGHPDLSQRLAEAGLLPMFGFPTKSRTLFTHLPDKSFPWPPAGAIARDLDVALSKFAPDSEVPHDGRIYKSIGIAALSPGRRKPRAEEEPFGPERTITLCKVCSHLHESADPAHAPIACPACGASKSRITTFPMREPGGFRAAFEARDYDGNRDWGGSSSSTRTAADLEADAPRVPRDADDWIVVHSGSGQRYMINNGGGKLYRFSKDTKTSWKGYTRVFRNQFDVETALGASQHSDMLFLGARESVDSASFLRYDVSDTIQPSGFPESFQGRRAAWYSLSALLRRAAAPFLDVRPEELLSGIHGTQVPGAAPVMAFLADSLDNGAGFSTHLGSPDVVDTYLEEVDQYLTDLGGDHASTCRGSCYDCLRDYTNMRIHPLLDWRLARDLFRALRDRQLKVDVERHSQLLLRWAQDYGAQVHENEQGAVAVVESDFSDEPVTVIVKHPLEIFELNRATPRLRALAESATQYAPTERLAAVDAFVLDRTPASVHGEVEGLAGS